MEAILAFIKALPILWEIYNKAEKALGTDWPKKSMELIDAYGKARDAKTPDALMDAAKRVHDAWSK